MDFDFAKMPRARHTGYAETVEMARRGVLSIGFVWDIAKFDEVFTAYLRKIGFESP